MKKIKDFFKILKNEIKENWSKQTKIELTFWAVVSTLIIVFGFVFKIYLLSFIIGPVVFVGICIIGIDKAAVLPTAALFFAIWTLFSQLESLNLGRESFAIMNRPYLGLKNPSLVISEKGIGITVQCENVGNAPANNAVVEFTYVIPMPLSEEEKKQISDLNTIGFEKTPVQSSVVIFPKAVESVQSPTISSQEYIQGMLSGKIAWIMLITVHYEGMKGEGYHCLYPLLYDYKTNALLRLNSVCSDGYDVQDKEKTAMEQLNEKYLKGKKEKSENAGK